MKKILLFILTIMFSVSSFAYTLQRSTKNHPKKLIEVENLVNEKVKPTKLSDFKEKVVILYFGFSNCKCVCPTVNAALKQVAENLNEKGLKGKYQIVFITVDPKRDNPKTLKEYKKTRTSNEFTFLTGKPEDLKKALRRLQNRSKRS
jgi:protein SCO1/2